MLGVLALHGLSGKQPQPVPAAVSNTIEHSEAIDAYRRGRFLLESGEPDGIERSRAFFRRAIDADGTFAPAYAAMAETYQLEGRFDEARPYALDAVRLDENLPEAHLRVAAVAAFADWNWADAEDAARTALELAPASAEAYHAIATIYSVTGRMDLTIDAMRTALVLDPASTLLRADYGTYLYYHGDLLGAKVQCSDALQLDPSHYASQLCLYEVAARSGDYAEAMRHANGIVARWESQESTPRVAELPPTPAGVDAFERWRLAVYRETEKESAVSPLAYALVLAALDDRVRALEYLERSVRARETMTPFVLADPVFDALRDERRFHDVLRATNVQLTDGKG